MWPLIRGLWNARRGRKAAVAAIAPLVTKSRHRLDGIPERAWMDPYIVGFMMMLITLAARRAVNISDSQTLGAVQLEAWSEITEQRLSSIGDETLHLSASQHKAFELGCRNAVAFDHRALWYVRRGRRRCGRGPKRRADRLVWKQSAAAVSRKR